MCFHFFSLALLLMLSLFLWIILTACPLVLVIIQFALQMKHFIIPADKSPLMIFPKCLRLHFRDAAPVPLSFTVLKETEYTPEEPHFSNTLVLILAAYLGSFKK